MQAGWGEGQARAEVPASGGAGAEHLQGCAPSKGKDPDIGKCARQIGLAQAYKQQQVGTGHAGWLPACPKLQRPAALPRSPRPVLYTCGARTARLTAEDPVLCSSTQSGDAPSSSLIVALLSVITSEMMT